MAELLPTCDTCHLHRCHMDYPNVLPEGVTNWIWGNGVSNEAVQQACNVKRKKAMLTPAGRRIDLVVARMMTVAKRTLEKTVFK